MTLSRGGVNPPANTQFLYLKGKVFTMIAIASDHGGYTLRAEIAAYLEQAGIAYTDLGCPGADRCDYPDYAVAACRAVAEKRADRAILVCSTGIGMSMAANKIKGIRAALCGDSYSARYTRRHNDANVLCLGALVTGPGLALEIVDVFLNTAFEGGRHQIRIDKIMKLEND